MSSLNLTHLLNDVSNVFSHIISEYPITVTEAEDLTNELIKMNLLTSKRYGLKWTTNLDNPIEMISSKSPFLVNFSLHAIDQPIASIDMCICFEIFDIEKDEYKFYPQTLLGDKVMLPKTHIINGKYKDEGDDSDETKCHSNEPIKIIDKSNHYELLSIISALTHIIFISFSMKLSQCLKKEDRHSTPTSSLLTSPKKNALSATPQFEIRVKRYSVFNSNITSPESPPKEEKDDKIISPKKVLINSFRLSPFVSWYDISQSISFGNAKLNWGISDFGIKALLSKYLPPIDQMYIFMKRESPIHYSSKNSIGLKKSSYLRLYDKLAPEKQIKSNFELLIESLENEVSNGGIFEVLINGSLCPLNLTDPSQSFSPLLSILPNVLNKMGMDIESIDGKISNCPSIIRTSQSFDKNAILKSKSIPLDPTYISMENIQSKSSKLRAITTNDSEYKLLVLSNSWAERVVSDVIDIVRNILINNDLSIFKQIYNYDISTDFNAYSADDTISVNRPLSFLRDVDAEILRMQTLASANQSVLLGSSEETGEIKPQKTQQQQISNSELSITELVKLNCIQFSPKYLEHCIISVSFLYKIIRYLNLMSIDEVKYFISSFGYDIIYIYLNIENVGSSNIGSPSPLGISGSVENEEEVIEIGHCLNWLQENLIGYNRVKYFTRNIKGNLLLDNSNSLIFTIAFLTIGETLTNLILNSELFIEIDDSEDPVSPSRKVDLFPLEKKTLEKKVLRQTALSNKLLSNLLVLVRDSFFSQFDPAFYGTMDQPTTQVPATSTTTGTLGTTLSHPVRMSQQSSNNFRPSQNAMTGENISFPTNYLIYCLFNHIPFSKLTGGNPFIINMFLPTLVSCVIGYRFLKLKLPSKKDNNVVTSIKSSITNPRQSGGKHTIKSSSVKKAILIRPEDFTSTTTICLLKVKQLVEYAIVNKPLTSRTSFDGSSPPAMSPGRENGVPIDMSFSKENVTLLMKDIYRDISLNIPETSSAYSDQYDMLTRLYSIVQENFIRYMVKTGGSSIKPSQSVVEFSNSQTTNTTHYNSLYGLILSRMPPFLSLTKYKKTVLSSNLGNSIYAMLKKHFVLSLKESVSIHLFLMDTIPTVYSEEVVFSIVTELQEGGENRCPYLPSEEAIADFQSKLSSVIMSSGISGAVGGQAGTSMNRGSYLARNLSRGGSIGLGKKKSNQRSILATGTIGSFRLR